MSARQSNSRRLVNMLILIIALVAAAELFAHFVVESDQWRQEAQLWVASLEPATKTAIVTLVAVSVATFLWAVGMQLIWRGRTDRLTDESLADLDDAVQQEKMRRQANRLLSAKRTEEPIDADEL